jgi:hypothetical protein
VPFAFGLTGWRLSHKLTQLLTFNSWLIIGRSIGYIAARLRLHSHSWLQCLLDIYVFRNGAFSLTKEECVLAVTASSSLWSVCILCHGIVLNSIYTRDSQSKNYFATRGLRTAWKTPLPRIPLLFIVYSLLSNGSVSNGVIACILRHNLARMASLVQLCGHVVILIRQACVNGFIMLLIMVLKYRWDIWMSTLMMGWPGTCDGKEWYWTVLSCSPLKVNRRFGGTCRVHLEGERSS